MTLPTVTSRKCTAPLLVAMATKVPSSDHDTFSAELSKSSEGESKELHRPSRTWTWEPTATVTPSSDADAKTVGTDVGGADGPTVARVSIWNSALPVDTDGPKATVSSPPFKPSLRRGHRRRGTA